MLTRLRDTYRRWRYRRLCNTVREKMFALTGDLAILELTDEELGEAMEGARTAIFEAGVSFEEAAAGIAKANRAWLEHGAQH